jgi:hypothetical protein
MHAHTCRKGRFIARLGLECLETRTLLSSTVTAPITTGGTVSLGSLQSNATQANAAYSFQLGMSPNPVLTGTNTSTGNGQSTGSVDFALFHSGTGTSTVGGSAAKVTAGLVVTTSSAYDARPDSYNSSFTLRMFLKDSTSGAAGLVSFQGTLKGTLSWDHSALTVSFQGNPQKLTLGKYVYTVTLPAGPLHLPAPGAMPMILDASVQVSLAAPATSTAFSYQWGITPGAILTGTNPTSGWSTGSVAIALYGAGLSSAALGGAGVTVPVALLTSTSSASSAHPDSFHSPITLSLLVKDSKTGASARLTFHATLAGTLTAQGSSLNLTFSGPTTQQVTLGGHVYIVTLGGVVHVPAPGETPGLLTASIRVQ